MRQSVLVLALLLTACGGTAAPNLAQGTPFQPTAARPTAAAPTPAPSPAPSPTPAPTATPDIAPEVKAEAVDLLGAAASERQGGKLATALDLANQAIARWPAYGEASTFIQTVVPQATATAAAAATAQRVVSDAATATAVARAEANAQATQARATQQAQVAAQAATQATEQARVAASIGVIGRRVAAGGVALTVNSVRRAASLSQLFRAAPGKTYLIVDCLIENVSRDTAPHNALYFSVKDAEGYEYNGNLFGDDRSLKAGELKKGETVRGTVAFEVPAAAKGFVLSYQPIVLFGGYETIRVRLE